MTSIHLDENDIDSVLAALPTGTVRETVFAHCRCITSSGRDIRDKALVDSQSAFEAFLSIFRGMSTHTSFCASLFDNKRSYTKAQLVARVRNVIERMTACVLQWWKNIIVEFAQRTDRASILFAGKILKRADEYDDARLEIKARIDNLVPTVTDKTELLWTLLLLDPRTNRPEGFARQKKRSQPRPAKGCLFE